MPPSACRLVGREGKAAETTHLRDDASNFVKITALLRRKAVTLDNSLPASDLLQSLQKITNIVYLTKLDAGDKVKVRNYMNDAERELRLLKHVVMKLATPNSPQPAN